MGASEAAGSDQEPPKSSCEECHDVTQQRGDMPFNIRQFTLTFAIAEILRCKA